MGKPVKSKGLPEAPRPPGAEGEEAAPPSAIGGPPSAIGVAAPGVVAGTPIVKRQIKSGKRMTVEHKIDIIERLLRGDDGYTKAKAAREFGVSPAAITQLFDKYGSEEGLSALKNKQSVDPGAKSCKEESFPEINTRVYRWYEFVTNTKQTPVTASMIKTKVACRGVEGFACQ